MSAPCLTVPAWPPPLTPCRGYRIGYGRVSTRDQNPDSQRDALTAAGCDEIFTGKGASGKLAGRPELDRALARLRPGDTLVITRLSRAMRSLRHLLELAAGLSERKVHLQVLKQGTGTSTPQGRLVFHVPGAIDEFQRELIVEGTHEGLGSARARGRTGGRPRVMPAGQVRLARQLASQRAADGRREYTITRVAKMPGVSRPTLHRALEEAASGEASAPALKSRSP
jgi:DNA invertase Pin-like site-specific DNA recombinase